MTDYDKFVQDRGWAFKTDQDLKNGYERLWKSQHGIMISPEEFAAEANESVANIQEVYETLECFVETGKLTARELYHFARFKWCLQDPKAIIACQVERDRWIVNNCNTEVSIHGARMLICLEFCFEASRIRIEGVPYYDATDYNFIRFDCGAWSWVMHNGSIYQVYQ